MFASDLLRYTHALKLMHRYDLYLIPILFNHPFFIHRDDDEVLAFQLAGTLDEAVHLSLQSLFGRHVVANLDEAIDMRSLASHEIRLLVVTGTVVEERLLCVVTSAH